MMEIRKCRPQAPSSAYTPSKFAHTNVVSQVWAVLALNSSWHVKFRLFLLLPHRGAAFQLVCGILDVGLSLLAFNSIARLVMWKWMNSCLITQFTTVPATSCHGNRPVGEARSHVHYAFALYICDEPLADGDVILSSHVHLLTQNHVRADICMQSAACRSHSYMSIL